METKKTFKFYTIFEHEKEQDYLREMHKSGWKFVRVTGLGVYHFEKCTPEDVIYQLDYNQEGLDHKEEYVQMFRDCGWEYMQDFFGYSYFRKPAAEAGSAEEIFCDDYSKIQMLNRVRKGRLLPLYVILGCVLLPGFFINLCSGHFLEMTFFIPVILLYTGIIVRFGLMYLKYRR